MRIGRARATLDMAIRPGLITPDDPDYQKTREGLRLVE